MCVLALSAVLKVAKARETNKLPAFLKWPFGGYRQGRNRATSARSGGDDRHGKN